LLVHPLGLEPRTHCFRGADLDDDTFELAHQLLLIAEAVQL